VEDARGRDVAANEAVNAVRAAFAAEPGVQAALNAIATDLHDRTILGTRAKSALEALP
jgi:hypothetical protein